MADSKNRAGDVIMDVAVVLGRAKLSLGALMNWSEGSLVELENTGSATDFVVNGQSFEERERKVGHSRFPVVDVEVNGQVFAKGEVVTVGEQFGARLLNILKQDKD